MIQAGRLISDKFLLRQKYERDEEKGKLQGNTLLLSKASVGNNQELQMQWDVNDAHLLYTLSMKSLTDLQQLSRKGNDVLLPCDFNVS